MVREWLNVTFAENDKVYTGVDTLHLLEFGIHHLDNARLLVFGGHDRKLS